MAPKTSSKAIASTNGQHRKPGNKRKTGTTTQAPAIVNNSGGGVGEGDARGAGAEHKRAHTTKVMPTVEKDPPAQLVAVNNFMISEGLTDKFWQLPPAMDLTFATVGANTMKENPNFNQHKMFVGGRKCADKHEEFWAYLKENLKKSSEVQIFVTAIPADADGVEVTKRLPSTQFKHQPFMYPFRAVAMKNAISSKIELLTLIQYYFLEAGKAEKAWAEKSDYHLTSLKAAVKYIAKVYAGLGGAQNVPDLYTPTSIPDEQAIVRPQPRAVTRHRTVIAESSGAHAQQESTDTAGTNEPLHKMMHRVSLEPTSGASAAPAQTKRKFDTMGEDMAYFKELISVRKEEEDSDEEFERIVEQRKKRKLERQKTSLELLNKIPVKAFEVYYAKTFSQEEGRAEEENEVEE
ncbi:hypothetical protein M011DRAFT_509538 [Sporormia fimetaria CBS 119925]|uniref:Uncharacterized protein n=1 Tax=Sporormia fimetaria CBS 119925 TaxID=1340428 RepID=A0A6A6VK92_9PLEO|nr:hypothetical protein M011DRAFT_509538 [Sporormia fimetaria CBS 119925]